MDRKESDTTEQLNNNNAIASSVKIIYIDVHIGVMSMEQYARLEDKFGFNRRDC